MYFLKFGLVKNMSCEMEFLCVTADFSKKKKKKKKMSHEMEFLCVTAYFSKKKKIYIIGFSLLLSLV